MTKQSTNTPQQSLRALIADDAYVAGFQTVAQYRAALLRHNYMPPTSASVVTNEEMHASAAVKCECGKPLGRNVAIDVHQAMGQSCDRK